jgi:protein-S-isoprenylcysteine O-methyltransferase Ste14
MSTNLKKRTVGGLSFLLVMLAVLVFLPAWSVRYWQGWMFVAVFFMPALVITLNLCSTDPQLLERRIDAGPAAEQETSQKIIQSFAQIVFSGSIVFAVLDHRFGWSSVPVVMSMAGDVLIVLGYVIVYAVFRANSFASATVEVTAEQSIVSTGPYAIVRHPMYAGALVLFLGLPLALGSFWGLFAIIPFLAVIVFRLIGEERLLVDKLPGYAEYRKRVRYRLVPMIW